MDEMLKEEKIISIVDLIVSHSVFYMRFHYKREICQVRDVAYVSVSLFTQSHFPIGYYAYRTLIITIYCLLRCLNWHDLIQNTCS